MKLEDRLAVKLLAQAQSLLGRAVNESLCVEPDRAMVQAMVREAQGLIDEFNDAYGDQDEARARGR